MVSVVPCRSTRTIEAVRLATPSAVGSSGLSGKTSKITRPTMSRRSVRVARRYPSLTATIRRSRSTASRLPGACSKSSRKSGPAAGTAGVPTVDRGASISMGEMVTVAPTTRSPASKREETRTSNHRSVSWLGQGIRSATGVGSLPARAVRMASATRSASGSSARAQAVRYETPTPARAGSPPLARQKSSQAPFTQTITPSASRRATSTVGSRSAGGTGRDPGTGPPVHSTPDGAST